MSSPSMELYCTNGRLLTKRLPGKMDHDLMLKLLFEKAKSGDVHGVKKPVLHVVDDFHDIYYRVNSKRVRKDNEIGVWLKEIMGEYNDITKHYASDGIDIKMSCILKVYRFANV